ncbi:hypothetical protein POM88_001840 [Heracleum sosnowskyi]|uniref:Uncharacterized protein n=1 Tax=Heracleum sosnowskyi TaxID=360622 RepID=A0AAD8JH41_9APIA|nr:hypothetical protein POM88_001840 [Heracleum sosnowskyi]
MFDHLILDNLLSAMVMVIYNVQHQSSYIFEYGEARSISCWFSCSFTCSNSKHTAGNGEAENAKYLFDNLPFMGSKDFVKKVQRSNDLLAEMEAKIFACQMTSPTIYVNVDVLAHIFSSTDASTASMLEGLLNKEIPQKLRASTHTHIRTWTWGEN